MASIDDSQSAASPASSSSIVSNIFDKFANVSLADWECLFNQCLVEYGEPCTFEAVSIALSPHNDYNEARQFFRGLSKQPSARCRCGEVWNGPHIAYRCHTCAWSSSSCICVACFNAGTHEGHDFQIYKSDLGGCCDCGDSGAWKPSGFCKNHVGSDKTRDPSVNLPSTTVERLRVIATASFGHIMTNIDSMVSSNVDDQETKQIDIKNVTAAESHLEWLVKLASRHDGFRRQLGLILMDDTSGTSLCHDLLCRQAKLSNLINYYEASSTLDLKRKTEEGFLKEMHTLLNNCFLDAMFDSWFKEEFSKAFLGHYSALVQARDAALDRVTVQVFSIEALCLQLIHNHGLLQILFGAFQTILEPAITQNMPRVANFKHSSFTTRMYFHVVHDLKFVTDHAAVLTEIVDNPKVQNEFWVNGWLKVYQILQTANPHTRLTDRHILWENQNWPTALVSIHELVSCGWPAMERATTSKHLKGGMHFAIACWQTLEKWLTITANLEGCWFIDSLVQSVPGSPPIAVEFEVSSRSVSLHCPLNRVLSFLLWGLIINQPVDFNYSPETTLCAEKLKQLEINHIDHILSVVGLTTVCQRLHWMEHPLRALVFHHQVTTSECWRKNGIDINEATHYRLNHLYSPFLFEPDLLCLRLCTLILPTDSLIETVYNRFEVCSDLIFLRSTQSHIASSSLDEDQILGQLHSLIVTLLHLLSFESSLNSSRSELGEFFVIQKLLVNPRSHWEALDASHNVDKKIVDHVLTDFCTFKPTTSNVSASGSRSGATSAGVYIPNQHCWFRYDHYHVTSGWSAQQSSEEAFLEKIKLGSVSESDWLRKQMNYRPLLPPFQFRFYSHWISSQSLQATAVSLLIRLMYRYSNSLNCLMCEKNQPLEDEPPSKLGAIVDSRLIDVSLHLILRLIIHETAGMKQNCIPKSYKRPTGTLVLTHEVPHYMLATYLQETFIHSSEQLFLCPQDEINDEQQCSKGLFLKLDQVSDIDSIFEISHEGLIFTPLGVLYSLRYINALSPHMHILEWILSVLRENNQINERIINWNQIAAKNGLAPHHSILKPAETSTAMTVESHAITPTQSSVTMSVEATPTQSNSSFVTSPPGGTSAKAKKGKARQQAMLEKMRMQAEGFKELMLIDDSQLEDQIQAASSPDETRAEASKMLTMMDIDQHEDNTKSTKIETKSKDHCVICFTDQEDRLLGVLAHVHLNASSSSARAISSSCASRIAQGDAVDVNLIDDLHTASNSGFIQIFSCHHLIHSKCYRKLAVELMETHNLSERGVLCPYCARPVNLLIPLPCDMQHQTGTSTQSGEKSFKKSMCDPNTGCSPDNLNNPWTEDLGQELQNKGIFDNLNNFIDLQFENHKSMLDFYLPQTFTPKYPILSDVRSLYSPYLHMLKYINKESVLLRQEHFVFEQLPPLFGGGTKSMEHARIKGDRGFDTINPLGLMSKLLADNVTLFEMQFRSRGNTNLTDQAIKTLSMFRVVYKAREHIRSKISFLTDKQLIECGNEVTTSESELSEDPTLQPGLHDGEMYPLDLTQRIHNESDLNCPEPPLPSMEMLLFMVVRSLTINQECERLHNKETAHVWMSSPANRFAQFAALTLSIASEENIGPRTSSIASWMLLFYILEIVSIMWIFSDDDNPLIIEENSLMDRRPSMLWSKIFEERKQFKNKIGESFFARGVLTGVDKDKSDQQSIRQQYISLVEMGVSPFLRQIHIFLKVLNPEHKIPSCHTMLSKLPLPSIEDVLFPSNKEDGLLPILCLVG
eukprot:GHVL01033806.1.p1 GENE.GHVL01033806.1~~GHVL01033806.1.p1  ORF type:complete len:1761 (-),score=202.61 GHVL01033806.1:3875-9157(-)